MDSITIDAFGFKKFVLENNPSLKEIDEFCVLLAHSMDVEPFELGDKLSEVLGQEIYCPIHCIDIDLSGTYGFLTCDILRESVEIITANVGMSKFKSGRYVDSKYHEIEGAWYKTFESVNDGWYEDGRINGSYRGGLIFGSNSELEKIAKQLI